MNTDTQSTALRKSESLLSAKEIEAGTVTTAAAIGRSSATLSRFVFCPEDPTHTNRLRRPYPYRASTYVAPVCIPRLRMGHTGMTTIYIHRLDRERTKVLSLYRSARKTRRGSLSASADRRLVSLARFSEGRNPIGASAVSSYSTAHSAQEVLL
jgi:hypothetical protein